MCDAAGVFASTWQTRAVGVLIGCLLDVVFGDPKRGHPVALFGRAAAKLEQITYRDGRVAGAVHVGLLVGAVGLLGAALQRLPGHIFNLGHGVLPESDPAVLADLVSLVHSL